MKLTDLEHNHSHKFSGKTREGLEKAIDNLFVPDIPIPYRKIKVEVSQKEYETILEMYDQEFGQLKQNIASIDGALNNLKEVKEVSIFVPSVGTLQIKVQ